LSQFFEEADFGRRLRDGCVAVAKELGWQEPLAQTEALYAELCEKAGRS
jgi:hypothetical protein